MTDGLNKEELLKEISSLLKDEFVANISTKDDMLVISFLNGQKFKLKLTEM